MVGVALGTGVRLANGTANGGGVAVYQLRGIGVKVPVVNATAVIKAAVVVASARFTAVGA